jgi:hypothetical protein
MSGSNRESKERHMPVVVYRQPWFWAIIIAVVAILGFVVVIAASNDRTDTDSTTIVQQPAPANGTHVVPVPNGSTTTQPAPPAEPAEPAKPAEPRIIRERQTIIRERPVPVPVPVPAEKPLDTSDFQSTGLPRQMRFHDKTWQGATVSNIEATRLRPIGTNQDGAEVLVEVTATEPYDTVFIAVPDEAGAYVRYRAR